MPEDNLTSKLADELFDIYEHGGGGLYNFVAKLKEKDLLLILGEIDTETIAKIIWKCMDITADTYFGDVE